MELRVFKNGLFITQTFLSLTAQLSSTCCAMRKCLLSSVHLLLLFDQSCAFHPFPSGPSSSLQHATSFGVKSIPSQNADSSRTGLNHVLALQAQKDRSRIPLPDLAQVSVNRDRGEAGERSRGTDRKSGKRACIVVAAFMLHISREEYFVRLV